MTDEQRNELLIEMEDINKNRKIEGYWYANLFGLREYPMPEPNVLTQEEAQKIHDLIKVKEKTAKITRYRGWSSSRITQERLGSTEYRTDEWLWPCDFASHYVLEHKVKPTDDFLEYIGYE